MVVHSKVVKKVGGIAAVIGLLLMAVASLLFVPMQNTVIFEILAGVILGHVITIGIYFVMIGVFVWILGAAIEYRATKSGVPEIEGDESA